MKTPLVFGSLLLLATAFAQEGVGGLSTPAPTQQLQGQMPRNGSQAHCVNDRCCATQGEKQNRSARQTDYHNVRLGGQMLTRVFVLITALLVGCNRGTEKAAEPGSRIPKQYTVADFYKNVSFDGDSWSPDKRKLLVSSNLSGIWNAYAVSLDRGDPQPLTKSTKDSVFALSYFPHDEKIVYSSDQGGNELTHIYVRNVDGSAVDITPGKKLKANFHSWSGDYKSFFVSTNER